MSQRHLQTQLREAWVCVKANALLLNVRVSFGILISRCILDTLLLLSPCRHGTCLPQAPVCNYAPYLSLTLSQWVTRKKGNVPAFSKKPIRMSSDPPFSTWRRRRIHSMKCFFFKHNVIGQCPKNVTSIKTRPLEKPWNLWDFPVPI